MLKIRYEQLSNNDLFKEYHDGGEKALAFQKRVRSATVPDGYVNKYFYCRLFVKFYPEFIDEFKNLSVGKYVSNSEWRLLGGPWDGTKIIFCQMRQELSVRIFCKARSIANELNAILPELENVPGESWMQVHITIEVISD